MPGREAIRARPCRAGCSNGQAFTRSPSARTAARKDGKPAAPGRKHRTRLVGGMRVILAAGLRPMRRWGCTPGWLPRNEPSACRRGVAVPGQWAGGLHGHQWRGQDAGRGPAGCPILPAMGLIQVLEYQVPEPNAAQRAMWRISSSRPGAWFFARSAPYLDRFLLRLSRGQATLATVVAGIPVITIVTTGARTGQHRTTPLLGVPVGDDIAVIGTRFGQRGTPGWYYNLAASPAVEVSYRGRSVTAAAREAGEEERHDIWERARKIYAGYEVYARRIQDRQIHIMILSLQAGPSQEPRNDFPAGSAYLV